MVKKVLMIDDDPEFVEAISNLLDAKGYDVHTASNGKDGVAKAKVGDPDIILLDVMMMTKNEGFNVARELHDDQKLKDTPIIIMTGIRREMNLPFGSEPDEAWLPVKRVLEKRSSRRSCCPLLPKPSARSESKRHCGYPAVRGRVLCARTYSLNYP